MGVAKRLSRSLNGELATAAGRGAVLATIEIMMVLVLTDFTFFSNVGAGSTHPRCFFVRVANKGVMVDAVCKSGKCGT
jgi:hypothetical protein